MQGPQGEPGTPGVDTLGNLPCANGQSARFDGVDWQCDGQVLFDKTSAITEFSDNFFPPPSGFAWNEFAGGDLSMEIVAPPPGSSPGTPTTTAPTWRPLALQGFASLIPVAPGQADPTTNDLFSSDLGPVVAVSSITATGERVAGPPPATPPRFPTFNPGPISIAPVTFELLDDSAAIDVIKNEVRTNYESGEYAVQRDIQIVVGENTPSSRFTVLLLDCGAIAFQRSQSDSRDRTRYLATYQCDGLDVQGEGLAGQMGFWINRLANTGGPKLSTMTLSHTEFDQNAQQSQRSTIYNNVFPIEYKLGALDASDGSPLVLDLTMSYDDTTTFFD